MLSAAKLVADIRAGKTRIGEVLAQVFDTIDAEEELIGAFEAIDHGAARPPASGALCGLPVGIKDIFDTADMPSTYGSPIYAGHMARTDAAIVSLCRRAGATVIGKTVTTEFAFMQAGRTRNPRNPAHSPGGSSSGSAAAVAAGMLPLAVGTQTGGSVVRPASFCGIAGYKPTFGLLPTVGMKTFSWTLDTVGLFGAGVVDAALFAALLTGRDLTVGEELPPPRIGVVETHLWNEASGEMRAAVGEAARLAADAGARVETLQLAGTYADAFAAHQVIQDFEANLALSYERDNHSDELSAILREMLDAGDAITPEAYDAAQATARSGRHGLGKVFADVDVILTPSAPGAAPEGLGSTGSSIFNRLWTLMGTPAVNVPGLASDKGLPLGVQIVGPVRADRTTLAAAAWLERVIAARS
ncbi:amidase [Rhodobium gokarnense]|uniref:Asp-tRNA(Asn)/Glu-tRNA(Gln) amidotransferase A subunit family amidase n=1 Tax=Rhodobium gokarnense TaxID=364296 RepID=A0ABT3H9J5_9HYPH|nr:amidase [Rhodobium gokarnense]MCW2307072.1 Asp-tRNA(Asn)/Glu-tRNA(Gln) amidotransferase A subunit family amidase [Rhodobium gokarnense]